LTLSTLCQVFAKPGTARNSIPPARKVPFRTQRVEKSAVRTTVTQMGCLTYRNMKMFQTWGMCVV